MKRREFISLVGGAAAAWPRAVWAQTTKRVWRIGVMDTTSVELNGANFAAFVHALQNLGYIENENLVIEYRSADGRPERFSELAKELVGKGVDIILARGTPAALAVKNFCVSYLADLPLRVCDRCGSKNWDTDADAIAEEAVRREYVKLLSMRRRQRNEDAQALEDRVRRDYAKLLSMRWPAPVPYPIGGFAQLRCG